MKFSNIISDILSLIFPPKCELCGRVKDISHKSELCPECAKLFDAQLHATCPICKNTPDRCTCDKWRDSFGDFPPCVLGFYFKERKTAPQELIFALKHSRSSDTHKLFARLMSARLLKEYLSSSKNTADVYVTYPPRSKDNEIKYGFDHGKRLARSVANFTGAKFEDVFVRSYASEQKFLSRNDRLSNADSSLTLAANANVRGKDFIIIDDIITTGATLKTCVKLLRSAGAKSVRCTAILRTAPHSKSFTSKCKDDVLWFE